MQLRGIGDTRLGMKAKRRRWMAFVLAGVVGVFSPLAAQTQPAPDKGAKTQEKPAQGDEKPPAGKPLPQLSPDARYDYQGEATFIVQHIDHFSSPYEGVNSLRSRSETELSHTYTLYLGARVVKNLEVFVNPEIAWGNGISEGFGLSGFTNGDIIGQPSLRPEPYLARYFVRWRIPMRHLDAHTGLEEVRETQASRAPNIIEGNIPAHRLVVTIGKFGIADIFDVNSYANNPRTQFLNNAFGSNLAYDYAEEIRGYNLGTVVAWVNPTWSVRLGSFAMPTVPGGPDLAYNLSHDHSEQLEIELHPRLLKSPHPPDIVRLLAFHNIGTMGGYRDVLAVQPVGSAPDLGMVRKSGAQKYGFGLNFEQALADGGATGVFGRLGWNDGVTESSNFECDRFLSLGGQLSGAHWGRKDDRVALALAQSDLSSAHKDFLAAGGIGSSVGDGKLRYGSERILEAYYSCQVSKSLSLSADYQYVGNPGYNRDRGPASVFSLRAHYAF